MVDVAMFLFAMSIGFILSGRSAINVIAAVWCIIVAIALLIFSGVVI